MKNNVTITSIKYFKYTLSKLKEEMEIIMIIDFHTHTFPDSISEKVVHKLSLASCTKPFTNGSMAALLASMKQAGVDYSVNLPVMTSPQQVEKINQSMIENRQALLETGIIAFGGLHPDYTDYKSQLKQLKAAGIKGIKLHPAYQNVDLDDIRYLRIIEAASALDLIVLIHAGIDVGIYDHNYSSVSHFLKVIQEVAPPKFVLAHMGNWGCWDEVERDLAGAKVYLDTAFSVGSITPAADAPKEPIINCNLTQEAFIQIVTKHGADKILFATDSPWEDQTDYINRIMNMPLSPKHKDMILGENAQHLLNL